MDPQTGNYTLNIAMALFADGSAEGDWDKADAIRNKLTGAALAAPKIKQKLATLNQSDTSSLITLSEEFKLMLKDTPTGKLSKWQQIGYANEMAQAIGQAEILKRDQQSPEKIRKRILELNKRADRQTTLADSILDGGNIK